MYRIITFCDVTFQILPLTISIQCRGPTTPATPCDATGLGCSPFARHYLRNHFCFLLLWVLRCFSSPRSLSLRNDWPSTSRVAPFGNLGIKGYLHLPQAYRSLSRPSSPPRAKASTVCPCLLSLSMTQFSKLIIKQLIINLACRIDISLACSYFFVTLLF